MIYSHTNTKHVFKINYNSSLLKSLDSDFKTDMVLSSGKIITEQYLIGHL
jgi:hypothetical protein